MDGMDSLVDRWKDDVTTKAVSFCSLLLVFFLGGGGVHLYCIRLSFFPINVVISLLLLFYNCSSILF